MNHGKEGRIQWFHFQTFLMHCFIKTTTFFMADLKNRPTYPVTFIFVFQRHFRVIRVFRGKIALIFRACLVYLWLSLGGGFLCFGGFWLWLWFCFW
jgi:hypothetical protein